MTLKKILEKVSKRKLSVEEAEKLLKFFSFREIEKIAKLDVGRELRKGIAEIILAEGKETEGLIKIVSNFLKERGRVIISRANKAQLKAIRKAFKSNKKILKINEKSGTVVIKNKGFKVEKTGGKVGILTAGTSDIPVAEEAKIVAEEMGCQVFEFYDVGVAGIHRLFSCLKELIKKDVDVIIVFAGREGALPSVVAGLVDVPVIGVPTSSGYGIGGKGVSAFLAMLQSCSLGIGVVNIDNGIGAGTLASLIANRAAKFRRD
ncbi:MAG: nickel pincer cofactor biosynthesis protein LarB [Candidatus Aenigmatarchaeota archaeon]